MTESLQRLNRLEEARENLTEATRVAPLYGPAWLNRGAILSSLGDDRNAEKALRRGLMMLPFSGYGHANLGWVLYRARALDEAVATWLRGAELGFPSPIGLSAAFGHRGELDKAFRWIRIAAKRFPEHAWCRHHLGYLREMAGERAGVIAAYEDLIRIDPEDATAHCWLAWGLLRSGRFAEAVEPMRRALELGSKEEDPEWPYEMWARDFARAAELEGRLHEILDGIWRPETARDAAAAGLLCLGKGRWREAVRAWNDALTRFPELVRDPRIHYREEAAMAAILAAAEDGAAPEERASLSRQARTWLLADLAHWKPILASDRQPALSRLEVWRLHHALRPVRDEAGLARLPEHERAAWTAFWSEVNALVTEAWTRKGD
jgi:tetratricopeptide (TPR) repeat protein